MMKTQPPIAPGHTDPEQQAVGSGVLLVPGPASEIQSGAERSRMVVMPSNCTGFNAGQFLLQSGDLSWLGAALTAFAIFYCNRTK